MGCGHFIRDRSELHGVYISLMECGALGGQKKLITRGKYAFSIKRTCLRVMCSWVPWSPSAHRIVNILFLALKHKGNILILQTSIWFVLNTNTLYVYIRTHAGGFPGGSVVKNLPAMQEPLEMQVWSLGWEDPQEEDDNPLQYSCWEIPWIEETGKLQSMGSQNTWTLVTEHTRMQTYTYVYTYLSMCIHRYVHLSMCIQMQRCTCVHLHTHCVCSYAHICMCMYIYVCVCIYTHITYFRYTGDGWLILKSGWKVYKLVPHDVTAWLWGPGIEVATVLELGCGRDLGCVRNVPRRVLPPPGRALPLAGLGPWRFERREANPSIPHVRCRADPQIKLVTLHYETHFCFRHEI